MNFVNYKCQSKPGIGVENYGLQDITTSQNKDILILFASSLFFDKIFYSFFIIFIVKLIIFFFFFR